MVKVLELTEDNALKAYNEGDSRDKQLLEKLYGKEVFNQKITDRVKTFEDACAVLGVSVSSVLSSADTTDEAAYKKLKVIAKALNEGWQADWKDHKQYKYYPYFIETASGFSFRVWHCNCRVSHVSSRLCFKNAELATYAGKQFETLYKDFLTTQN